MPKALLFVSDALSESHLRQLLESRRVSVVTFEDLMKAKHTLADEGIVYEFVVVTIKDRSRSVVRILRELQDASRQRGFWELPLFLCVSYVENDPELQLQIERLGARYVFQPTV
jgi:hypothetical protein